ncbi:UNVERIFIED_CONTAM: hypothetical protein FKN15_045545 [Acipenser sinensis]
MMERKSTEEVLGLFPFLKHPKLEGIEYPKALKNSLTFMESNKNICGNGICGYRMEKEQWKICYLSSLGGITLGDTVRRIMKKVATYRVWAQFSLKGRKGKSALADISICRVLLNEDSPNKGISKRGCYINIPLYQPHLWLHHKNAFLPQNVLHPQRICYLSSLGGITLGDTVRRIMKKVATYRVWAQFSLKGRKGKSALADISICRVLLRRGRQPIDIRLSVMAVTRRALPIESITGAEALVESCGDGEPQKKKRATEQSLSSSRGETLGSPVNKNICGNGICGYRMEKEQWKVCYLSSLGVINLGDTVRRIMKKVATYRVWAQFSLKGRKGKSALADISICRVLLRRGRQPIDIRLSVMAVTRRALPIESITGAEALVESCGDGEPQKKKRATEQSLSSSRGETLGSPVYER